MAVTFPTLDQIDPAVAWQPWQPTAADPWGRKWAAHLYRRAAFGSSREELDRGRAPRLEGTLDLLLRGKAPRRGSPGEFDRRRRIAADRRRGGEQLRGWWLYGHARRRPPAPREADSVLAQRFRDQPRQGAEPEVMLRQNSLIREYALGEVRPIPAGDEPDPAMLAWLNPTPMSRAGPTRIMPAS